MEMKVRLFVDNKQITPEEARSIEIRNAVIDRIVNDVIRRSAIDRNDRKERADNNREEHLPEERPARKQISKTVRA